MEQDSRQYECACFFKRNVTLNDIHNVETVEQIMNEVFWNQFLAPPRILPMRYVHREVINC